MDLTKLTLHTSFEIGPVDPRIFGGFLEHMGRSIYEGVFDPGSAHADDSGLRIDVLAALDRLKMPVVRYPGGNFVSGYHWQDGVGPLADRPTLRELAWSSIETNQFGTNEFIGLCRKLDWSPMFAVNLGTGTPEEARNWVEYCNAPPGTKYADQRADHGAAEPHAVPLWCLGNEMDGPWQLGHGPVEDYVVKAKQAARMMRTVDPTIEFVGCGSSMPGLKTYLDWDRAVIEGLGTSIDYISLHRYVGNHNNDTADFLAVTNSIDRQIEAVNALCVTAHEKRSHSKGAAAGRSAERQVGLCFDEWNVWYKDMQMDGAGKAAPPLIEERYNVEDALVVAGFLNSFIRHADVVKIANIAQLVNVIAPIQTRGDDLLIQSIFHVFEQYSNRRNGTSLRVAIDGPYYHSQSYGPATIIDSSAILDGDQLHVFATNRSLDQAAPVNIALVDRPITSLHDGQVISGPDAKAENTFECQDIVTAARFDQVDVGAGGARLLIPPLSVVTATFDLE